MWPEWWYWELDITLHLEKRMIDRDFSEIDLRTMFEYATGYERDVVKGRWIIKTRNNKQKWI